jgi:hypothetical protein
MVGVKSTALADGDIKTSGRLRSGSRDTNHISVVQLLRPLISAHTFILSLLSYLKFTWSRRAVEPPTIIQSTILRMGRYLQRHDVSDHNSTGAYVTNCRARTRESNTYPLTLRVLYAFR